jgi:signal transduction histidine kinase
MTCFLISLFVGLLSLNFNKKTTASYRHEYLGQKRLHLSQVVGSLRNEILNSNLRYVRNYLEKLRYEGLFEEFKIKNAAGETIEHSDASAKSHLSSISIPVYFSDAGKKWGTFEFYIDQNPLLKIEDSFNYFLIKSVFMSVMFILASVFCLNFIYFNTSRSLIYMMRDNLEKASADKSSLFRYIFAPLVDLSETIIKDINEKNVALQKMEKERIYYELAQSVAHDIRSPLSSLKMTLSFLTQDPQKSRSLLSKSIERISNIADDLLSQPKIHADNNPTPFSVDSKATPSISDIKKCSLEIIDEKKLSTLHNKKIRISFYDECPGFDTIVGEPSKVLRILSNIIDNAIDAISETGFITVTKSKRDSSIIIEVRDNGRGISAENLNLLRSSPQTLGKPNGNGLGLLSAVKYLKTCGGELRIDSELNHGSTVTLRFRASVA